MRNQNKDSKYLTAEEQRALDSIISLISISPFIPPKDKAAKIAEAKSKFFGNKGNAFEGLLEIKPRPVQKFTVPNAQPKPLSYKGPTMMQ